MGVVANFAHDYRFYTKGASELCKRHVVVHQEGVTTYDTRDDAETAEIDDFSEENITRTIIFLRQSDLAYHCAVL